MPYRAGVQNKFYLIAKFSFEKINMANIQSVFYEKS